MFDVRSTLLTRRLPPIYPPGASSRGLAELCRPRPTSIRDLAILPPANRLYATGALGPSTVTGGAQLYLDADGFWSFKGAVHESGAVGHNFVLHLSLLDVPEGAVIRTFLQEGTVNGSLEVGNADDTWELSGHDDFLAANWSLVRGSRIHGELHVSTDPWQVVEVVTSAVGAILVAAVVLLVMLPSSNVKCQGPAMAAPTDGASGVDVQYQCQYE